jgi:hypothetical protein
MTARDYIRLTALIPILKEVQQEYQGQTIDNIIRQIEARVNYVKGDHQDDGQPCEYVDKAVYDNIKTS